MKTEKYPISIPALLGFIGLAACLACPTAFAAQEKPQVEDPRMAGFKGKIAKTYEESVEDWPKEQTFTGDEPNVLIVLLDDVGYGQLGAADSIGGCNT